MYYILKEGVYFEYQTRFFLQKTGFIPFSSIKNIFTSFAPNDVIGKGDLEIRTKEKASFKSYNFILAEYEDFPKFIFMNNVQDVSAILKQQIALL